MQVSRNALGLFFLDLNDPAVQRFKFFVSSPLQVVLEGINNDRCQQDGKQAKGHNPKKRTLHGSPDGGVHQIKFTPNIIEIEARSQHPAPSVDPCCKPNFWFFQRVFQKFVALPKKAEKN